VISLLYLIAVAVCILWLYPIHDCTYFSHKPQTHISNCLLNVSFSFSLGFLMSPCFSHLLYSDSHILQSLLIILSWGITPNILFQILLPRFCPRATGKCVLFPLPTQSSPWYVSHYPLPKFLTFSCFQS
jgi:hypothetical protein